MRVLIVNTSERAGGAAVAANRLMEALNNNGVKAKMLVRDKQSDDIRVASVGHPLLKKWYFLYERLIIFTNNLFNKRHLFEISIANVGFDITRTREFKEADIIHLQWINQGFLSLRGIHKILRSGKPIVWTMHDMWELTAICHYSYGCERYAGGCGNCHFLRLPGKHDLSKRVFNRKTSALRNFNVRYTAVSNWLANNARASKLLEGQSISVIPNLLSLDKFVIKDKSESRRQLNLPLDGKLIVFGAARIDHTIKGLTYLLKAISILMERHVVDDAKLHLLLFGDIKDDKILSNIPIPFTYLGRISCENKLSSIYSAADVAVSPSLYETFGQTIVEALACGCVPVSFNNSGQTDIIEHERNGYLAQYKSEDDLSNGIEWALNVNIGRETLRRFVVSKYSESVVTRQYIELYNNILKNRDSHQP